MPVSFKPYGQRLLTVAAMTPQPSAMRRNRQGMSLAIS